MSGSLPPWICQDVCNTPYQLPHPVNMNNTPLQQYQYQADAPQPCYDQQQSSGDYDRQSNSFIPFPQSGAPPNVPQLPMHAATTQANPQYPFLPHLWSPQYVSQPQESLQPYPTYEFPGQPPWSNWQGPLHPQQQMYSGHIPQMVNVPHAHGFPHGEPQQFLHAPSYTTPHGGSAMSSGRSKERKRCGGRSANAARKRKAVDDNSMTGESSSGALKRIKSHASNGFRTTSTAVGPSNHQTFSMTGMQFDLRDQSRGSGMQGNQYRSLPQNGSSRPLSQVPQGYYNHNGGPSQVWQRQNESQETSVSTPQFREPPIVHQNGDRGQQKPTFNNGSVPPSFPKSDSGKMNNPAIFLRGASLLRYVCIRRGKIEPYSRWFITDKGEIMLLASLHTGQNPSALHVTGAADTGVPFLSVREARSREEAEECFKTVLITLAKVQTVHKRLVALTQPVIQSQGSSNTHNGSQGFHRLTDNFAGPSGHPLPTPARTPVRTPVQPDTVEQTLPPIPIITVEDTDTTDTSPVVEISTTPTQPESLRLRNEDSGEPEDGPEAPPCPPSPVDRPPTPLECSDEKPSGATDDQVESAEEENGGPSDGSLVGALIMDMPWFNERSASSHKNGEEPVASASTSTISTKGPSTVSGDDHYERVYNEFMDADEAGEPLLSEEDADADAEVPTSSS
ncbi:uncharacterized protein BT62DRAFT_993070 [Guyanagaster necrorhizus]|uniref:Uncharacterized protein n=1 Tax=Guyanagaster necrorhizus TaxID=856835 RepID=A0A9P8AUN1_9AGAR|nr:uncharacterized protein BT62DRAFT_993070 [Guyanagaster necrorhizus MCA 3950]KAG7448236.1 hypothetical protein BT62DRAFT_993070 [Guyanagaster necrorhizus MCA 3950]